RDRGGRGRRGHPHAAGPPGDQGPAPGPGGGGGQGAGPGGAALRGRALTGPAVQAWSGSPVSSSVLRSLSTSGQPPPAPCDSRPPPTMAARFGAPASSWVTVSEVTPRSPSAIS